MWFCLYIYFILYRLLKPFDGALLIEASVVAIGVYALLISFNIDFIIRLMSAIFHFQVSSIMYSNINLIVMGSIFLYMIVTFRFLVAIEYFTEKKMSLIWDIFAYGYIFTSILLIIIGTLYL